MISKSHVLTAAVVALLAAGGAQAQTETADSVWSSAIQPANVIVSRFEQTTGARVAFAGGLSEDQMVPFTLNPSAPRKDYLDTLAAALNATYVKTWVVSPAASARQLPDAAGLSNAVLLGARVTIEGTGIDPLVAIRSVAAADGASVKITGEIPRTPLNLNVNQAPVADAIALIAHETHTSWTLRYTFYARPQTASASVNGPARRGARVAASAASNPDAPVLVHVVQRPLLPPLDDTSTPPALNPPVFGLNQIPLGMPINSNLGIMTGVANVYGDNPMGYSNLGLTSPAQSALADQTAAPSTTGQAVKTR